MGEMLDQTNLHRQIGLVFAWFCALMFFWNLATPSNPDHVLNLFMHCGLTLAFLGSTFAPEKAGFIAQVAALGVGAIVTGTTGSYYAAGAVGAVAILMYYSTTGLVSMSPWQPLSAAGLQWANIAFSAWMAGKDVPHAIGHGTAGMGATMAALWALWLLSLVWKKAVIVQNRNLLEILKERECKDGPRS